ncbi:MAG: hypothetical protein US50_C0006G0012 [Candidatus Nomurabacteria bacterium GW2011_GWB1_37_5]|uniref:MFS transporter n=1 Tax=Candidatus Nomurabacteria bacterium GW2011_GWB1_37_5 TaxID=1618742 RepID=A0A0G0JG30_9BACT|nr:MAG: hypothetical protein US50_C0006G0012 [Candidatus Nomurabacteria bacterium GW2011_GWB1_37_5]
MYQSLTKFKHLSAEKKSMLALFWVYEFANTTAGIFVNIFVFLDTRSLWVLALLILVQVTATLIGFTGFGYLLAEYQRSMRWNYLRSFSIYFISFIWLALTPHTLPFLIVFYFLYGLGGGIFWATNHSYELIYTKNEDGDRDFYASMVQSGTQLIFILSPLLGTALLLLADKVFQIETFSLLFWVLPFIYLLSLPFLFRLPHFVPKPITKSDIKSFMTDGEHSQIRWYYILSAGELIRGVISVFFAVVALKTAVNIGLWETAVAIISFFAVFTLANTRRENNRLKIMLNAICGFLIAFAFLYFSSTYFYFYLIYSVLMVFFRPMYRVSQHAIDLHSMEFLSRGRSSFYPGILYREIILYIGRFFALMFVIVMSLVLNNDILSVKIGIIISAILLVLHWHVARKMLAKYDGPGDRHPSNN